MDAILVWPKLIVSLKRDWLTIFASKQFPVRLKVGPLAILGQKLTPDLI